MHLKKTDIRQNGFGGLTEQNEKRNMTKQERGNKGTKKGK